MPYYGDSRNVMREHVVAAAEILQERPDYINHMDVSMDEVRFEVRIPTSVVERHLQDSRRRRREQPQGMPEINIQRHVNGANGEIVLHARCGEWNREIRVSHEQLATTRMHHEQYIDREIEHLRRMVIEDWHHDRHAREAMERGNHPSTFAEMRAFAERQPFNVEYLGEVSPRPVRNRVEQRPSTAARQNWGEPVINEQLMRDILTANEAREALSRGAFQPMPLQIERDDTLDSARLNLTFGAGLQVQHPSAAVRIVNIDTEAREEEQPMPLSKAEQEERDSRSVMVVDVTVRDLRTLKIFMRENDLEDDLMMQYFRLKGGEKTEKYVMILTSMLSVQSWISDIKPKIIELFSKERCRFETGELESRLAELMGGDGE